MNDSLRSPIVAHGAKELLNQALVATWTVFEHFASHFIIERVNEHPHLARRILASPELKTYFGKQTVDLEALDEHGYDLTRCMGAVVFSGKRLDNLAVVRNVLSAMSKSPDIRKSLGADLWKLNQRRHLLVHKRGLIDREYLKRTGDDLEIGQRLTVSSEEIECYLNAVQIAIAAIASDSLSSEP